MTKNLLNFDYVVLGSTGDLALRKLIPALYCGFVAGQFSESSRIICIAQQQISRETYVQQILCHCHTHLGDEFDEGAWASFTERVLYLSADASCPRSLSGLKMLLDEREQTARVFFLSTAPDLFVGISQALGANDLITAQSRIVLEKPLGHDRASAEVINSEVGKLFHESQIYRVDHYLGKETVQNLLAIRFGNALFEPLWSRERIQQVQITVAEQIGIEKRAGFYDRTGALRDMVQNHLLQLVCIVAMEPPATNEPNAVRDEKLKVLRALKPIAGRDVLRKTVRGQYKTGVIAGRTVRSYTEEEGIPDDSNTETFVAIKAEIDTWRWSGVPFYLRTGKRLQQRLSEIVITFGEVPHSIFEPNGLDHTANRLIIRLQPEESITLEVLAKDPGHGMRLRPVRLRLDMAETFKARRMDAYERLLSDVARGDLTLFMRHDELDAAWRWIDPIVQGWREYDERPRNYMAGSWGPDAAITMLNRDCFSWHGDL